VQKTSAARPPASQLVGGLDGTGPQRRRKTGIGELPVSALKSNGGGAHSLIGQIEYLKRGNDDPMEASGNSKP